MLWDDMAYTENDILPNLGLTVFDSCLNVSCV